jgi:biopolymer transport protein TolR
MRKERRKPMSEINVVPYIDVMLVLLIIFMITAPMLMQGVEVELPDAAAEPIENQEDEPLIVSVKADGSYYLNLGGSPEKPEKLDVIKEKVGKILKAKPKTPVLVWGDEKVSYGIVVVLMSELQEAGAKNVGLVTENP